MVSQQLNTLEIVHEMVVLGSRTASPLLLQSQNPPPGRPPFGGPPPPQSAPQGRPKAASGPAVIVIEVDGKIVGERKLDKQLLTVGRLQGNDVHVPNQRVSRLHAKIHSEDGAWIIEDSESVNGILYNGKRVERVVFSDGDSVALAPGAILHYRIKR